MNGLKWDTTHVVFVPEMDDEHKEIFDSLAAFQAAVSKQAPRSEIAGLTDVLKARIADHLSHEERIMRASRYAAYRWHKKAHDGARRRVREFIALIEEGDRDAGPGLVEYLTTWLHDHMRLADMMLGAFLRNHQRSLYRVTFRAGTKPADACRWFDSKGQPFDPSQNNSGY